MVQKKYDLNCSFENVVVSVLYMAPTVFALLNLTTILSFILRVRQLHSVLMSHKSCILYTCFSGHVHGQ